MLHIPSNDPHILRPCMTYPSDYSQTQGPPYYSHRPDSSETDPYQDLVDWYAKKVLNYSDGTLHGVTSFGSSDSLYTALSVAKARFSREFSNPQPVVMASSEAHSSLQEICQMLKLPLFRIVTRKQKGMDMDLLKAVLEDEPHAIVVLTMGSLKHQLYDNMDELYINVIAKLNRTKIHVHVDATYGGLVYPFLCKKWLVYPFDTMNVSLHRHLELPYRCALCVTSAYFKTELDQFKCNPSHEHMIMSKEAIPDLVHSLLTDNSIRLHKEELMKLVNKKNDFMELNPHVRCYHPLSLKVFFRNIPTELKACLDEYKVVTYPSSQTDEGKGEETLNAYLVIDKNITRYMLVMLTSSLGYKFTNLQVH